MDRTARSDPSIHNSDFTSTYHLHATFWYFSFEVGQGNCQI